MVLALVKLKATLEVFGIFRTLACGMSRLFLLVSSSSICQLVGKISLAGT